ncbi:MAG: DUF542 domain-containing protein [Nitrospinota bacterium]|nr:DUF542 domain-containing protein [Nitrospinota bacterium]
MSLVNEDMVINDVVRQYPQTMKVFNDHKVDSCCGGGQSIKVTAAVSNSDLAALMRDLNQAVKEGAAK